RRIQSGVEPPHSRNSTAETIRGRSLGPRDREGEDRRAISPNPRQGGAPIGPLLITRVGRPSTCHSAFWSLTDPGGAEPNAGDPTPGIGNHYTSTIQWGDGTPNSIGTLTQS